MRRNLHDAESAQRPVRGMTLFRIPIAMYKAKSQSMDGVCICMCMRVLYGKLDSKTRICLTLAERFEQGLRGRII